MSLTKPMLGLAVGGTLGLLDGLSGFLVPSLAPVMTSVITFLCEGIGLRRRHRLRLAAIPFDAGGNPGGNRNRSGAQPSSNPARGYGHALGHHAAGMLLGVVVGFATQNSESKQARRVAR